MSIQIPLFEAVNIVVIGDLMLDRYWHGSTSRISPEAPVPVVHVGEIEERPGGAGNVALNIARLGGQCQLMGLTGDDEAADALQKQLQQSQVECHFTRLANKSTITKLRVLSRHQQLIRLDFEDGFDSADVQKISSFYAQQIQQADVVICSDYGKGGLSDIEHIIQLARDAGKPVLVDPKGSDFSKYKNANLITPNLSEFEAVVGTCKTDDELVKKGKALCEKLNLGGLLITRSERGMTLLEKNQLPVHIPTHAQDVFDVTGAGDTVIAVFAAALAAGKNMSEATSLANLAAGVVVGKLGTASVTRAELKQVASQLSLPDVKHGLFEENELQNIVSNCQLQGENIVMTNGCFDILHAGHVAYLEQARKLGDRLIVAVNSDDSVKRLKGESRPVNTLAHRMVVLAALSCVDWVVAFSEDTPERLICKLLPNVLVKGGDYTVDKIAGARCVLENNGDVKILQFVDDCSTSKIIEKIQR